MTAPTPAVDPPCGICGHPMHESVCTAPPWPGRRRMGRDDCGCDWLPVRERVGEYAQIDYPAVATLVGAPTPAVHEYRHGGGASAHMDHCWVSLADGYIGDSPVHRYCGLPEARHPAPGVDAYAAPVPEVALFPLNAYVWDVSRGLRVAVRAGRGRVIEQRPGADGFRYVVAMDSGAWLHGTPEAHLSARSPEDLLLDALDAATAKLAAVEALCADYTYLPPDKVIRVDDVLAIIRRQA